MRAIFTKKVVMVSHRYSTPRAGFSLVELSIVLVILGLLVGGILTGKTLIRASQLRSVTTQYSEFYTATRAFRDKYFMLPGDLTNAVSIWGDATTCAGDYSTSDSRTCNGDGDGKIGLLELGHFWVQLSNAGLIGGKYCGGRADSGCGASTLPWGPRGKLGRGNWEAYDYTTSVADSRKFDGVYNNSFSFQGLVTNNSNSFNTFTPQEVWGIDTKMDDGKPAYGKMVVITPAATRTAPPQTVARL
jgi:prepilin-type N-terminal cleavage/methylation domain-containing protein